MGIINLLRDATQIFLNENNTQKSFLQRKLDIGYELATIIIEELELIEIISSSDYGERVLYISSMDEFEEKIKIYYFTILNGNEEQTGHSNSYDYEEEPIQELSEDTEDNDDENITETLGEIGSHSFSSSISRGGDVLFPEHIYLDDFEVTWEKKSGVFSKESKTIPITEVTQIDIQTTLLSASIIIRSKGYGQIKGEYFSKSDASRIKKLIEKVKTR
jgi:hypothetical protein